MGSRKSMLDLPVSSGVDSSTIWRRSVSPILVRPVREQLEHDRIIRLLQTKARRRYDAGANPGVEQNAGVRSGGGFLFPDLVLYSQGRGHKLEAVIEVETGESVNHLEALAQWTHFSKLRAEFYLYRPAWSTSPVAYVRTIRFRSTRSGVTTLLAIKCGSHWCIAVARLPRSGAA